MNSSLNGFRGYVGIVDFGPGTDDSVIIASSPHKVRRDALHVIVITNPATGTPELNTTTELTTTTDSEASSFLTEIPATALDIDNPLAVDLWYRDLAAAVTYPKLTIYGPHTDAFTAQRRYRRACEATRAWCAGPCPC
jgi:hypothetical protein